MRAAAASLVHADDATIAARALELGFDERRLRAHVVDARRRLPGEVSAVVEAGRVR